MRLMHEEYGSMNSPTTQSADDQNDTNGGSPIAPRTGALPESKPSVYRRFGAYIWVAGILGVTLAAVAVYFVLTLGIRTQYKGATFVVKKEPMLVTIVERGSLESAENSDIVCRVKAGGRGSTNASTIKWVVDDGTLVKKDDKIVDLEDSGFQDQLKTQKNTVNQKYADWVQANNDYIITESQNISDIKTAEVNLIQAQLELKKYAGELAGARMIKVETQELVRKYLLGEFENDVKKESSLLEGKFTSAYLQDISVIEGTIETARSDKDSWLDRASWSQRMVKKGFYSLSQADADQSRLASTEIALRKAQGDLDIYRIFEREKNVTKKWSDVKEAERALNRVEVQAKSKMKQKQAVETAQKSIYDQEDERLKDLVKEEKYYKIVAPQDGMVVYYIPEQARFGGGTQQATVAQGEPVREGQKLIRIPNLTKMLVNARVHEAMVAKVKGEKLKPTGFSDCLRVSFGMGRSDLFALASYQFGYDEARDKYRDVHEPDQINLRDQEHIVKFAGQEAKIRVDAHPGKTYRGHVKTVATVPSQADFLSSDVKLYQTMVSIDDLDLKMDKLKPGMSAEVTILADAIKEPVIIIPIQSVVGNVGMGADRKCKVLDAKGIPQDRDIKLGMSNDTMVEVKSGLEEGETVVLNPRSLIPENSGMKTGTPGTRKGAEFDDAGGKKGKKGSPSGPPPGPASDDGKASQGPGGSQNRPPANNKK
jgi:HlyD family secretion protein